MRIQAIILIIATFTTGIMAGIFFAWSNAVTAGLARLTDMEYLRAFQSMNRTILNPIFFLTFFGPAILLPISSYQHFKIMATTPFWMLLAASMAYLIGVIIVTFAGNIPLNKILDESVLGEFSSSETKFLRENFENKWNSLNWIRTYSASAAFLLLIIICLTNKANF